MAGTPQTHKFCKTADVDWVKFTATAGTTYVLATSALATNVDTVMDLYASDGKTLVFSNDDASPAAQGPSRIEYVPPTAGTYYVKVTDYNNASGAANSYTLTLSSRSTCNNYEPDDQTASQIQLGTVQAHAFCVAADTDTAYFTVTTAGTYRIRTFGLARPQTDTILQLQNQQQHACHQRRRR